MNTEITTSVRQKEPLRGQFNLVQAFAQRDLKARFKGSALGWVWSLLVPLATLAIYSVVFSLIFRAEPPEMGNGSNGIFAVWLFCGLVFWSFFSGSITSGMGELMSAGNILQKVYFPSYAPVLGAVWAVGAQSLIEVSLLAAVFIFLGNVGISWLILPVFIVLVVVFTAAVSVSISIMNVYFRDLAHLTTVALQLLFYVTPVIYPMSMVANVKPLFGRIAIEDVLYLNPLTSFVELFRSIVYGLNFGTLQQWGYAVVWTLVATGIAVLVFKRRGEDLGENI